MPEGIPLLIEAWQGSPRRPDPPAPPPVGRLASRAGREPDRQPAPRTTRTPRSAICPRRSGGRPPGCSTTTTAADEAAKADGPRQDDRADRRRDRGKLEAHRPDARPRHARARPERGARPGARSTTRRRRQLARRYEAEASRRFLQAARPAQEGRGRGVRSSDRSRNPGPIHDFHPAEFVSRAGPRRRFRFARTPGRRSSGRSPGSTRGM